MTLSRRRRRATFTRLSAFALACVVALPSWAQAFAQRRSAPTRQPSSSVQTVAPVVATRPRLVLLIAVDQFRQDYLERFGDLFVANGLRRLMREGAMWPHADFDHVPTETAPGHATMMTGAWPAETGVIGNEWFDRDTGRRVWNIQDDSVRLLGGGESETKASPRRLLASTLGDELRLNTNGRSKVVGVSHKDRSAILPAGRHANAAYWFSPTTGLIASSTYYFNEVPAWVARFNAAKPADKYFGKSWERLLPEAEYTKRAGRDDAPWENRAEQNDSERYTKTFPHVIKGTSAAPDKSFYNMLENSPFANDLTLDFAKEALVNEALGADEDTDVLTVSFSANDYIGHRYGPFSHETMDGILRVDRQIADLLDFVERRVGLRHTLVAFTSDHGVSPVPEHAATLNLPGRRIDRKDIETAVRNGVRARFDRGGDDKDSTADYFLDYTPKNGNIYFNPVALARDQINREELERVAGEAALTVPGVARYFTRTQLTRGGVPPADPVARRVLHGYNARRSGDVVVVIEPFVLVVTYTGDHFSPYSYDTNVPVMLMGPGVTPGRYTQTATPADIAPTLAALLRMQPPSSATGRVLSEALKQ